MTTDPVELRERIVVRLQNLVVEATQWFDPLEAWDVLGAGYVTAIERLVQQEREAAVRDRDAEWDRGEHERDWEAQRDH